MIKKFILFSCAAIFLNSCVVVKEYEKININDPDMALSDRKSARFVTTAQAYREADQIERAHATKPITK